MHTSQGERWEGSGTLWAELFIVWSSHSSLNNFLSFNHHRTHIPGQGKHHVPCAFCNLYRIWHSVGIQKVLVLNRSKIEKDSILNYHKYLPSAGSKYCISVVILGVGEGLHVEYNWTSNSELGSTMPNDFHRNFSKLVLIESLSKYFHVDQTVEGLPMSAMNRFYSSLFQEQVSQVFISQEVDKLFE